MAKKQTEVLSHVFGRNIRPLEMVAEDCADYGALAQIGINLPQGFVRDQIRSMGLDGMAMDDAQGLITTASISNPVQFLQSWLPGFVRVMTAARRIDEIVGVTTAGKWDDEEVIQGILEPLGAAALNSD